MGQAKQRGTLEQRIKQAQEREAKKQEERDRQIAAIDNDPGPPVPVEEQKDDS